MVRFWWLFVTSAPLEAYHVSDRIANIHVNGLECGYSGTAADCMSVIPSVCMIRTVFPLDGTKTIKPRFTKFGARDDLKTPCVCVPVSSIAARQHLRSAVRHQLAVPSHRLSTYGRRAFAIAGPTTWNSLPTHRHVENSTAAFGRLLKTHCFLSTSVYSALGGSAIMRYINRRFTYLLTLFCRFILGSKGQRSMSHGSLISMPITSLHFVDIL